ncbi:Cif family virulence factor [Solicola gregarius]|uniref:DUF4440 domain-containing protein n=1 Tax=Solicola gregarius TaxID=2908642 RepID=A0AA46TJB1_9ACTN|nr:hypothetical protein [Solicola gregarius]UYM06361.1 hypothetical protein L0C25_04600 [Solicola gregarius]
MTTSEQTTNDTAETIARFNDACRRRDKEALADVVHDDCLMVSAQPAPDGASYVGKDSCVASWAELLSPSLRVLGEVQTDTDLDAMRRPGVVPTVPRDRRCEAAVDRFR